MSKCLSCGRAVQETEMAFALCIACRGIVCSSTCAEKHLASERHKKELIEMMSQEPVVLTPDWKINLLPIEAKNELD